MKTKMKARAVTNLNDPERGVQECVKTGAVHTDPDRDDPDSRDPEVVNMVLAANQRFYDAIEGRDFGEMTALWERTDRVTCVHPGWPILRGHDAVLESWLAILEGPGHNQFILTNTACTIDGNLAWVTLDENLVVNAQTHMSTTINLYARHEAGWLLVSHHASPVMGG